MYLWLEWRPNALWRIRTPLEPTRYIQDVRWACPITARIRCILIPGGRKSIKRPVMLDEESWTLGPFTREDAANPCLTPSTSATFICPVRQAPVDWEAKDVFNPAAVVRDGKVYLLYRAEDTVGRFAGTSRIGLAE